MLRTDVRYVTPNGEFTQSALSALRSEMQLLATRLTVAEGKIAAAAAIANATGGATVDAEARTQLAAIRSALT